ncbi:hypothetical protein QX776_01880 [Alteromonadaceae bacterium BrNp21-10]|nr:hypothetical protein [Alteromonadaceae bacterium BrNp21-10]
MEIGSGTSTSPATLQQNSPSQQSNQVKQADQAQEQAQIESSQAQAAPAPEQRVGTVVDTQI